MEHPKFVQSVREDTRRYIDDLLAENQRLHDLTKTLETEKLDLRKQRLVLQEELLSLREDVDQIRQSQSSRYGSGHPSRFDHSQFLAEYSKIEDQNNVLANLYVASYRLHSSADRSQVLEALNEIVVNLVGSEEFVVFEKGEEGRLEAVTWFGLDERAVARIDPHADPVASHFRTGEVFIADDIDVGNAPGPKICIPLKLDGRPFGLVVIFRLLPHKGGLGRLDHELFDLLAQQAAVALYASRRSHAEADFLAQPA